VGLGIGALVSWSDSILDKKFSKFFFIMAAMLAAMMKNGCHYKKLDSLLGSA
jgi:hypothetical protein